MGYSQDIFSKIVKVALRDTGNKLLLDNNDSTSLVLPVKKLNDNKYQLSFENEISIEPGNLVNNINNSFEVASIFRDYVVEVINCSTKEVEYSYQIKSSKDGNIIPCLGRNLPLNCYKIMVVFTNKKQSKNSFITYIILAIVFIGFIFLLLKIKKINVKKLAKGTEYMIFGNYKFYENQNKIIINHLEIKLTPKESQILKILIQNQNIIVKREQLIKEVWEDNGIIVGRSLDAFISKIRKKFDTDNSINIINIHGVGYKFEVK